MASSSIFSSADRILDHYTENHSFHIRSNTTVSITYPKYGIGSLLTYVHLIVYVYTPYVNCTITAGGLKQRDMTLLIGANLTDFLNYDVQFYGL